MADTPTIKSFYDIKGWFRWVDYRLFEHILASQADLQPATVVELGCYLGKSTVVIGKHVRDDERFVVVDLFGREVDGGESALDQANRRENQISYKSLTRTQFERNYLSLHPQLPEVIEGLSSEIVDHVEPNSARFMHVDASHMYSQVRTDALNAKRLLSDSGVVAFDDFRSEHTPGVAAAVWESVINDGLIPFAITPQKLYGTYGDSARYFDLLNSFTASDSQFSVETQEVLGIELLRIKPRDAPAKPKVESLQLSKASIDAIADAVAAKVASAPGVAEPAGGHSDTGLGVRKAALAKQTQFVAGVRAVKRRLTGLVR